jgi:hypothetical protein
MHSEEDLSNVPSARVASEKNALQAHLDAIEHHPAISAAPF